MKPATVLLVLLSIGAGGASAFGQNYQSFQGEMTRVLEQPRFRLGPLRFFPVLRLDRMGYDDNVYYGTGDDVRGDYTGTVSPELAAYLPVGHSLLLSFSERPEYSFFLREDWMRTMLNSYAGAARLRIGPLVLSGRFEVQNHLRRAYSEFDRQIKDSTRLHGLSVFFETSRETALGFVFDDASYAFESVDLPDYSFDFAAMLDRRESTGSFEFYYRLFSESRFFLKAGATTYRFDNSVSSWRDSSSRQVTAGLQFPLLGKARGTLALGWKAFTPQAPGKSKYTGLTADTSLDFRFGLINMRMGYQRDNFFSYLTEAFFYVEDRFTPGLSLYLGPTLRLDLGYQYATLSYPEPFPVAGSGGASAADVMRRDTFRNRSVALVFRLRGYVGLSFSYNVYDRASNVPGFDINRSFVGANLIFDF